MSRSFDALADPRDPALRRRLRLTAAILVAVMLGLAAFSVYYISRNGRRSHTILHSAITAPGCGTA